MKLDDCPACGETILGDGEPIRSLPGLAGWLRQGGVKDAVAEGKSSGQD